MIMQAILDVSTGRSIMAYENLYSSRKREARSRVIARMLARKIKPRAHSLFAGFNAIKIYSIEYGIIEPPALLIIPIIAGLIPSFVKPLSRKRGRKINDDPIKKK